MGHMATKPDEPTWVGELDRLVPADDLTVDPRFGAARLLITVGGTPQGQVTVPLRDGRASRRRPTHGAPGAPLDHGGTPPGVREAVARAARDLREELRLDGVGHNDAVMFGPVVAQAVARLVDEVVPA